MNFSVDTLKDIAKDAVARAVARGADEVEVCISRRRHAVAQIRAGDILGGKSSDSTTIGIRVIDGRRVGFATVNNVDRIDEAVGDALTLARVSPADPHAGLPEAAPLSDFVPRRDAALDEVDMAELVGAAGMLIDRVKELDPRVSIDSGETSWTLSSRAVASSKGVLHGRLRSFVGGSLFGMAVDGDEVGSFDGESDTVASAAEFRTALEAAARRFVTKCTGALHGGSGTSFKGTVILTPEAVGELVLPTLLGALSGRSLRLGRSPYAGKMESVIASPLLTVTDPALDPDYLGSEAADREGMPTRNTVLIDRGVLKHYLYDAYEARRAFVSASGHATGGAGSLPGIGVHNLVVAPGTDTLATLAGGVERALLVTRWSGSCSPVTGDFSGVSKGGWLIENGERRPVREVQIAGNVFELVQRISGVGSEVRIMDGTTSIPSIRFEDVTVTAG